MFRIAEGVVDLKLDGLATVNTQLTGLGTRLRTSLASIEARVASLGRAFVRLGSTIAGVGGAGALGLSLTSFARQERAVENLRTALEQVGAGSDLQGIRDFASELQSITTVGDEATLELAAFIATTQNLSGDALREITQDSLALGRALGVDAQRASILLARALAGDVSGLTRYSAAVKLAETESEKLAAVQTLIASGFSQLTSDAQTFGGSLQQFRNVVGDLFESFGEGIVQSLGLTQAFNDLTDRAGGLGSRFQEAGQAAGDFARQIGETVGGFARFIARNRELIITLGQLLVAARLIAPAVIAIQAAATALSVRLVALNATLGAWTAAVVRAQIASAALAAGVAALNLALSAGLIGALALVATAFVRARATGSEFGREILRILNSVGLFSDAARNLQIEDAEASFREASLRAADLRDRLQEATQAGNLIEASGIAEELRVADDAARRLANAAGSIRLEGAREELREYRQEAADAARVLDLLPGVSIDESRIDPGIQRRLDDIATQERAIELSVASIDSTDALSELEDLMASIQFDEQQVRDAAAEAARIAAQEAQSEANRVAAIELRFELSDRVFDFTASPLEQARQRIIREGNEIASGLEQALSLGAINSSEFESSIARLNESARVQLDALIPPVEQAEEIGSAIGAPLQEALRSLRVIDIGDINRQVQASIQFNTSAANDPVVRAVEQGNRETVSEQRTANDRLQELCDKFEEKTAAFFAA